MIMSRQSQSQKGAVALGLASVAIGVAEIAAPRKLEHLLGIGNRHNTAVLRVLGIREIMQGIVILSHKNPKPGLWARVVGDVLDVTLLSLAAKKSSNLRGVAAACAMVMGIAALDLMEATRYSASGTDNDGARQVKI
jgi:hypothetical protein